MGTHNSVDRHLLRKPTNIPRRHGHVKREIRTIRQNKKVPSIPSPLHLRRQLPDHAAPRDRDAKIERHEVGAGVPYVGAAHRRDEEEEELGEVARAEEEKGWEGVEAEAFDDDGAELWTVC